MSTDVVDLVLVTALVLGNLLLLGALVGLVSHTRTLQRKIDRYERTHRMQAAQARIRWQPYDPDATVQFETGRYRT